MTDSAAAVKHTPPVCMECSWGATESGVAVLACPLHAAAPALADLLRRLVAEYAAGAVFGETTLRAFVGEARALLSTIEDTPDA